MKEKERKRTAKSGKIVLLRFIKTPSLKATPPRRSDPVGLYEPTVGEMKQRMARPSLTRTMENLLYIYTRDSSIVNMPFQEDSCTFDTGLDEKFPLDFIFIWEA
jgi:hypothetical protein